MDGCLLWLPIHLVFVNERKCLGDTHTGGFTNRKAKTKIVSTNVNEIKTLPFPLSAYFSLKKKNHLDVIFFKKNNKSINKSKSRWYSGNQCERYCTS